MSVGCSKDFSRMLQRLFLGVYNSSKECFEEIKFVLFE